VSVGATITVSATQGGFKASETLLGIETLSGLTALESWLGFKASETLLGIETNLPVFDKSSLETASKPLKPF